MRYATETTGRLLLPEELEAQALTVLEVELAGRAGPFSDVDEVDTLAELARSAAGAAVRREGDWLLLETDTGGDRTWTDQATAFYVGLARWAREGQVDLRGEDGARWSYHFGPDGVIQIGQNGWDGSLIPFGEPITAAQAPPTGQAPARAGHHPALLTLVFVVGIVLIIGVAMMAAGI